MLQKNLGMKVLVSDTVIYGLQTVSSLLTMAPQRILEVFIVDGSVDTRLQAIILELQRHGLAIQRIKASALARKTGGGVHQGIAARIRTSVCYDEQHLPTLLAAQQPTFLLVLDGVTDPHNLGACLRSADAAGVQAVIVPRDRAVQGNGTVSKVACGAAESVPLVTVTNVVRTLRYLQDQGVWVIGTSEQAMQSLYQQSLTGPLAMVMGSEGAGMRRLTREQCDALVRLPMVGRVASLNVSVATGICLFEAVRQRNGRATGHG